MGVFLGQWQIFPAKSSGSHFKKTGLSERQLVSLSWGSSIHIFFFWFGCGCGCCCCFGAFQILLLFSGFCLLVAVYYTIDVIIDNEDDAEAPTTGSPTDVEAGDSSPLLPKKMAQENQQRLRWINQSLRFIFTAWGWLMWINGGQRMEGG